MPERGLYMGRFENYPDDPEGPAFYTYPVYFEFNSVKFPVHQIPENAYSVVGDKIYFNSFRLRVEPDLLINGMFEIKVSGDELILHKHEKNYNTKLVLTKQ
jgi:hypothetical protein